jgi:hypothetical protein
VLEQPPSRRADPPVASLAPQRHLVTDSVDERIGTHPVGSHHALDLELGLLPLRWCDGDEERACAAAIVNLVRNALVIEDEMPPGTEAEDAPVEGLSAPMRSIGSSRVIVPPLIVATDAQVLCLAHP